MEMAMYQGYLFILLMFIGGVILIDLGIFTKTQTNHLFKWGVATDCEVVKVEDEVLPGGQHVEHPYIKFMTTDKGWISGELAVDPTNRHHFVPGERMHIIYNQQDPNEVKIDKMPGRTWLPTFLLVAGFGLMLAAAHQIIVLH
ncbi:DUF3592 domain-containing protein [Solitalea koreensis]|uniref:DUF3592 domain-containing protein n=1 Tax=Solitalea koreensis TaxID=543615 RepID=A0A521EF48_9SPHI|nr:DUF3592 domain-containing protein [Solitalea koreensis]SMO82519.1 hypothetical protein SAMN06265350_11424 [Solitalea koreensis]